MCLNIGTAHLKLFFFIGNLSYCLHATLSMGLYRLSLASNHHVNIFLQFFHVNSTGSSALHCSINRTWFGGSIDTAVGTRSTNAINFSFIVIYEIFMTFLI